MSSLEWMDDALCAEVGTEPFFPESHDNPRHALAVCQRCEVRMKCLDHALSMPLNPAGIWGGTTERERRDLRRASA